MEPETANQSKVNIRKDDNEVDGSQMIHNINKVRARRDGYIS